MASKSIDKKIYILRGVPASGKSTWAKNLLTNFGIDNNDPVNVRKHILSTDNYFMIDGVYRFDPQKLPLNHQKNQQETDQKMKDNITPLFIDNTNINGWEMKPYVELARKHDYEIIIINPIDYNSEENPIIIDGKLNRDLIKRRAQLRREDGSGKDIPDFAYDGANGRPGMFDNLERHMMMTPVDVIRSRYPSWHPSARKTRGPRKHKTKYEIDYYQKYIMYKKKYLALKNKLLN